MKMDIHFLNLYPQLMIKENYKNISDGELTHFKCISLRIQQYVINNFH